MKKILFVFLLLIIAISIYYYLTTSNKKEKNVEKKQIKKELISDQDIKKSIFNEYYKKAQNVVTDMTIEEKIGQLFLVRYAKEDIVKFNDYNPGGYILFAKDFENHTKESIREELKYNQSISKYPLIFGVDEEGGFVTRISRFKNFREERFKSPKAYYNEGGYELLETTENEKAKLLKDININLNLAPVADVSTNENDFIYNRAFGEDAKKTAEFVKEMVKYANNNHYSSCLKHFPGYGNNVDTHTGIAIDNREYNSFVENDYLPFKAGIEEKVPCILVSHNVITVLDNQPASLSKTVIAELREKLGFSGIIITDDLAMDAVKDYVTDKTAATMAINAGNDMIITSDFITMYNELLESYNNGIITEETINKAVLRIICWKYYNDLY
ncbi:MAG: beta-hexosaminidase [Bacilli bacterium]|nr:beta-hexosaminidase [Bacilli bacterium]